MMANSLTGALATSGLTCKYTNVHHISNVLHNFLCLSSLTVLSPRFWRVVGVNDFFTIYSSNITARLTAKRQ